MRTWPKFPAAYSDHGSHCPEKCLALAVVDRAIRDLLQKRSKKKRTGSSECTQEELATAKWFIHQGGAKAYLEAYEIDPEWALPLLQKLASSGIAPGRTHIWGA